MVRLRFWSKRSAAAALRCREAARLLQSFLDGQLDEQTAKETAGHLDECRRCGLEAEIYTEIKKTLARTDGGVSELAIVRLQAFAAALPGSGPDPSDGEA